MSSPTVGNGFTAPSGARAVTVVALVASLSLLGAESAKFSISPLLHAVWISLAWLPTALAALMLRNAGDRRAWVVIIGVAPMLAALAGYTAWVDDLGAAAPSVGRAAAHSSGSHLFIVGTALFVLCPFLQRWRNAEALAYAPLCHFAWDNALTLVVAAVLTGAAWLILWLCGALFALIGIDFFTQLFTHRWFSYPITGLFVGLGIALARGHPGAMQSLLRVCLTLGQLLLPLLALVALMFLPALLLTGLTPLWETRRATPLLLTLVLGVVALTNSVFQDGEQSPSYGKTLRSVIVAALFTLPVYALIAVYALYLRVDQYGWTVERIWAAIIVAVALGHALGYAAAALRRTPVWLAGIAPVNAMMALVAALALLLTQSPLLEPRGISTASQLSRLDDGQITAEKLDLAYFHWALGRPGRLALLHLRDEGRLSAEVVDGLLAKTDRRAPPERITDAALAAVPVAPADTLLPDGLRAFLMADDLPFDVRDALASCATEPCLLWRVDLNRDQNDEWLLLSCRLNGWPVIGVESDAWRMHARLSLAIDCETAQTAVREGRVTLQPPRWQEIFIDGQSPPQGLQFDDLH
jgi:hypothetical protein